MGDARHALASPLETFRQRVRSWTPFHEPEYLFLWEQTLAQPDTCRIVVAWDTSGNLAAYAPLMRVRHRVGPVPAPTLRFIGNNLGYPGDVMRGEVFATAPERKAVEAVLAHVASTWSLRRWELGYLPPSAITREVASEILRDGLVDPNSLPSVPFVSVELPGEWDVYLRALTRNTRSIYRRCLRHLEAEGGPRVVVEETPQSARRRVEELIQNHERWSAGTDKRGWFGNDAVKRFFVSSSELLARQGRFFACVLELNGSPIAWNVGPAYGDTYFAHLGSFDQSVAARSPGMILGLELMRELISRGFRRVDLGPGTNLFKSRLGGEGNPYVRLLGYQGWIRHAARLQALLPGKERRMRRAADPLPRTPHAPGPRSVGPLEGE